ncbi:MAG TPA: bifunctional serine/threonine-protein kinase/formylglycine-generating enzyme family protein [Verrucomicrobiae bacterium]|nr:bifunctional serine/threonine-protein kinase/formylglycine-generating enzyme family protein [Verrucomicrobiae bacterium]
MAEAPGGGVMPSDPLIGTQLGGYVIEALLGKGAMGAVYRAVQLSLNRHVALKVMAGHLLGSQESVARFWREARAAAAINHPNLVQVYDFGEADGTYFYAMELVDGLSLGAYLRRGDRFSERECIEVGREVTLALRAAHRAGVIHRDLKPDNLMLNSEGVVKVADLGIARFLPEGEDQQANEGGARIRPQDLRAWDSLTLTGMGMGTPAFMSPEQVGCHAKLDQRSDFYSLGATLFQLATCRLPYPSRSLEDLLGRIMGEAAPRAREVNPALGESFSDLVWRLMAKSPEDRPQTHEEILAAMEGCLRGLKGAPVETSRIQMTDGPRRGPFVTLARSRIAWGVAAAAIAVAGLFVARNSAEPDPWKNLRQRENRDALTTPARVAAVTASKVLSATSGAQVAVTAAVPQPAAATQAVAAATSTIPAGTGAVQTAAGPTAVTPVAMGKGSKVVGVAASSFSNVVLSTDGPSPAPTARDVGQTATGVSPQQASVVAVQESARPLLSVAEIGSASKDKPFVNSLGMRFVPIPGTKVLFSVWEIRVKDFEAFVKDSGYAWAEKPPFEQTPDHPVVMVSYDDADAFCKWLSNKDGLVYHLPSDEEWDAASGNGKYPWGDEWPPSKGVENIAGQESILGGPDDPESGMLAAGYTDGHPRTAPVGSYRMSQNGLYDMGGNAQEWVRGWYTEAIYKKHRESGAYEFKPEDLAKIKNGENRRISRGGGWNNGSSSALASSCRPHVYPGLRRAVLGFRCVLVTPSPFDAVSHLDPAVATELDGILAPLRTAKARAAQQAAEKIAQYAKDLESLEKKAEARSDKDMAAKLRNEREAWMAGQRPAKADASAKMPSEYGNLRFFLERDLAQIDGRAGAKREGVKAMSGLRSLEAKLTKDGKEGTAKVVGEIIEGVEKGEMDALPTPAGESPGVASESGGADNRLARPAPAATTDPATAVPSSATKDRPFVNSLGMKFVPVPGTKVLFSIWETRVRDFGAFVKDSGYLWEGKAPFQQTPEDPMIAVSWEEAKDFCSWLSKKEGLEYRLPTDAEWGVAVETAEYPWGDRWPPPPKFGNFAGRESVLGVAQDPTAGVFADYQDQHPRTAPVGSYGSTRTGLYDLSGNVLEYCEDAVDETTYRKLLERGSIDRGDLDRVREGGLHCLQRGGSWFSGNRRALRSAHRIIRPSGLRHSQVGFRCVLVIPSPPASRGAAFNTRYLPAVSAETTHASLKQGVDGLTASTAIPSSATKDKHFVNSLGMRFVPIPGSKVLFSIWETRVKDFGAFVKDSGYLWEGKAPFEQTPDHPVVMVSWDGAKAFCEWLPRKEGLEYRLPTDEEWDVAVGPTKYPWGDKWPPPKGVENIGGEEAMLGRPDDPKTALKGYRDEHPRTAPVGDCRATTAGLFDMGGNVREWLEDWYTEVHYKKHRSGGGEVYPANTLLEIKGGKTRRVARGGLWNCPSQTALASPRRNPNLPQEANENIGFRCVLVLP